MNKRAPSRLQRSNTDADMSSLKPVLKTRKRRENISRARSGTGNMRQNRKSAPKIVITKKDSLEMIEIFDAENEAEDIRKQLLGDTNTELTESDLDSRSVTTIESMQTGCDQVHFPKPNQIFVETFEDLLLLFTQVYHTVSRISPNGDPVACRTLSYLSAACFDMDLALRYLLLIQDNDDKIDTETGSDYEQGSNNSRRSGLLSRTKRLGTIGRVAEKLIVRCRNTLKISKDYQRRLFNLLPYNRSKLPSRQYYSAVTELAQSFAKVGELSAGFANSLYSGSNVFKICATSIPLTESMLEQTDELLAKVDIRLPRSSFAQIARDGSELFDKSFSCFEVLQKFWENQGGCKERFALEINTFEKPLLQLERKGLNFFKGDVQTFVDFKVELRRKDGLFNLDRFWAVYSISSVAAISPNLALKYLERTAFHKNFPDGVEMNFEELEESMKRQRKIMEFELAQRKRRKGRKRAFARRLRGSRA